MSKYAPRIETIQIIPRRRSACSSAPAARPSRASSPRPAREINIEDDGSVNIYSNNGDAMARAKEIILGMTTELEIGKIYHGRVVSIKEFGAFVECLPGKDGLVPHQRAGRLPREADRGRRRRWAT